MVNSNSSGRSLLIEFISIVFAVLLALFLNNWRDSLKTANTVKRVKNAIRTEIVQNDISIRSSLDYRRQLLKELYSNTHISGVIPIHELPIDINDDDQLTRFLSEHLMFNASRKTDGIRVVSLDSKRVLVLDDFLLQMTVTGDSLILYGENNIQLKTAFVNNRSWEIAQATGALVEMELGIVDALSKVHYLNGKYLETSQQAIEILYNGSPGLQSVLEDMVYYEQEMLNADSVLLQLLD